MTTVSGQRIGPPHIFGYIGAQQFTTGVGRRARQLISPQHICLELAAGVICYSDGTPWKVRGLVPNSIGGSAKTQRAVQPTCAALDLTDPRNVQLTLRTAPA